MCGLGFWVWGSGFTVESLGVRVLGFSYSRLLVQNMRTECLSPGCFGCLFPGVEFMVPGLFPGLEFMVPGLGFMFPG